MKIVLPTLCFACVTSVAAAKAPSHPLQCGSAGSIKPLAEIQLVPDQNIFNVQLTYVAKKPPSQDIDKALRDCLAVAAKKDGTKDILATAWLRKRAGDKPNDDDMLNPYGGMKYISYKASDKSISVRELKLQKK
jgi:hypothetical protein